jgi:hypothetical protein
VKEDWRALGQDKLSGETRAPRFRGTPRTVNTVSSGMSETIVGSQGAI